MTSKVLVLGALPQNTEEENFYSSIADLFEDCSTPNETAKLDCSTKERYIRAFEKVADATLIIAEHSKPSSGMGMELRESTLLKIPVIVICKTGSNVSGLVHGMPNLKRVIAYKSLEDLLEKLKNSI